MNYPKLPNRKSNLEKGYTDLQMRRYAEECVKQALMHYGATDEQRVVSLIEQNIDKSNTENWIKKVEDILVNNCNQSNRMAKFLAYRFAKMVPAMQWKSITTDEVISLIPQREIDLSALILLGKRVNNLLMERNTWK